MLSPQVTCSGLEIGDFVAVLTYTLNLFGQLNFLGSVYNAVVMALIDLRSSVEQSVMQIIFLFLVIDICLNKRLMTSYSRKMAD